MPRASRFTIPACTLSLILASTLALGAGQWPGTPFEESGGARTPRYEETVAWCNRLADASPIIHYDTFGVSPEGRPLPLVVADLEGRFDPRDHEQRGDRTVLLVEACIHAGESCGKDAGMVLLRDLAADADLARRLLDRTTLVFIPIFNVDGHERFSPYGRVNQNGPEEMGWRVTGQNLNLNRDFLKADTPEMQAWLGLFDSWDPDFFVDIHSTDGADYQYVLTYGLELRGNMEAGLTALTAEYRDAMHEAMAAEGFPICPYVSFQDWHDPRSGLKAGVMGAALQPGLHGCSQSPRVAHRDPHAQALPATSPGHPANADAHLAVAGRSGRRPAPVRDGGRCFHGFARLPGPSLSPDLQAAGGQPPLHFPGGGIREADQRDHRGRLVPL